MIDNSKKLVEEKEEESLPDEKDNTNNQEVEKQPDEENKRNKRNKNTMEKEFKLIKAINDIANNRSLDNAALAICAAGTEEMRKSGLSYGGQIQIPVEKRDITVASEGEDVVATELYDILEPLRAKNVLVQAGAKFISGLVGDVQIPVMNGSQVAWEGETVEAKDGNPTFSNVKLSPKRLTAFVDVSKQFLVQDSKDAENMLRQDLINAINSKLEATILGAEEGTATQPAGLFVGEEIPTVSDFKGLCELEAGVEDANVIGECAYVMSNKAKATFRSMAKSAKSTELVMERGEIDGTKVYNTSNVAATNMAYGDFSQLAIGQWGSIDLTVDPYTVAKEGKVRIVVNAFFDAKVLRENAIAVAKV